MRSEAMLMRDAWRHCGSAIVLVVMLTSAFTASAQDAAATPADQVRIAKDFKAELLYSVPKNSQGSWVSMCVDPKGRLIVSDQYGGLFRITPGKAAGDTKVETLDVKIGHAQGLLYAFDSLYVMVNDQQPY